MEAVVSSETSVNIHHTTRPWYSYESVKVRRDSALLSSKICYGLKMEMPACSDAPAPQTTVCENRLLLDPVLPDFRNSTVFSKGSPASPVCPSDKSDMQLSTARLILPYCSRNFRPCVFCAPQFLKDDFGFIFAQRISRTILLFIYQ